MGKKGSGKLEEFIKDNPEALEEIIANMPSVEKPELEVGEKEYKEVIKFLELNDGELVYFRGLCAYKVVKAMYSYDLGKHPYGDKGLKAILGSMDRVEKLTKYAMKYHNMHTEPKLHKFCYLANATSQEEKGFRWRKDLIEYEGNIDKLAEKAAESKVIFDREHFCYNCYIPIVEIKKANNKIVNEYIELTFKELAKPVMDWISLYAFENRYQISRPTLMLKSNKRGTGKNTFMESFLANIYAGMASEITFKDDFSEWGDCKLAYIDEGSDTKYNPAGLWDQTKQISGQGVLKVNKKFGSKHDAPNGVFLVIMTNEAKPIHIKDEIIDESKNQILVVDMVKDDETDKAIEKLEMKIHKLGYYRFSDFFEDHIGHWIFTDLLTHYKCLKQRTKVKPYRYGMPVPITKGLKKLLQMSLSANDIMILQTLEDLYYQNSVGYHMEDDERKIFNMFASGTPAPENIKGFIPFAVLHKLSKHNKIEISTFTKFLSKRGWMFQEAIRISPIKGIGQKSFYGILVNINKITEYFERQEAESQKNINEIREDKEFDGSFRAAHDEAMDFKEPEDRPYVEEFDADEEMKQIEGLL